MPALPGPSGILACSKHQQPVPCGVCVAEKESEDA